jgi:PPOX class probable F420-dependent enzyme
MAVLDQLAQQPYLNIETFRKNNVGVKTPVWFVQDGETIFIRTVADSGKVKRINHNEQVNIAPRKVDGALLGDWILATARVVKDNVIDQKVDILLEQKYGEMKKKFAQEAALQGRKYTVIEVKDRK